MSRPTFTVQNRDKRADGSIFEVLVDNAAGFDDFILEYGEEILPGSKVDFADYRKVFSWIAKFIPFEQFSEMVDDALVEMREMLEKNAAVAALVNGPVEEGQ